MVGCTLTNPKHIFVIGCWERDEPGWRVPRSEVAALNLNLRAYDTSRSSTNFGTEIPIPRSVSSETVNRSIATT